TLSKSAPTHQKHPPAKVAIAVLGGSFCCATALAMKESHTGKPNHRPRLSLCIASSSLPGPHHRTLTNNSDYNSSHVHAIMAITRGDSSAATHPPALPTPPA